MSASPQAARNRAKAGWPRGKTGGLISEFGDPVEMLQLAVGIKRLSGRPW